jgi:RimJ/RimL family protein N-acetyltransferase
MNLEPVPQTRQAAELIMRWRNDPYALRMSFHQEPKVMPAFWEEFQTSYFADPALPPLFGFAEEVCVGFLRFRRYDAPLPPEFSPACDISVMIAPEHRAKGYGASLVALGTDYVHAQGWRNVLAEIKPENTPSLRLFAQVGYQFLDEHARYVHDLPAPVLVRRFVHQKD